VSGRRAAGERLVWDARKEVTFTVRCRVFEQFLALCQSAGSGHCALADHGETVAQRVARLFARARQAPIPAPHAKPPGQLSYEDLLVSTFTPLRLPLTWPQFAADLDAAANGDASALETAAQAMQTPEGLSGATTSAAISCGDGPARLPSSAWPRAVARFTDAGKLWGRCWLGGCGHRAPRTGRPTPPTRTRALERQDQDPDPAPKALGRRQVQDHGWEPSGSAC
jgi:hypothetical protein